MTPFLVFLIGAVGATLTIQLEDQKSHEVRPRLPDSYLDTTPVSLVAHYHWSEPIWVTNSPIPSKK